jgi:hypothetical protein
VPQLDTAKAPEGIRLKATTVRAYINVLVRDPRAQAIIARMPPETADLIHNPPLASSWVAWKHVVHIMQAVESVSGMAGVRELNRRSIDEAKAPHMRILEGIIRLLGPSPAILFKRVNEMVKHTLVNIEFTYRASTDRSGTLEVLFRSDEEVPECMLMGPVVTAEALFAACGKKGAVGNPERLSRNRYAYAVHW